MKIRRDAVDWRVVDGEIVVLDLRTSIYLGINRSGATLWPLLAEGATGGELEAHLVERFALSRSQAAEDVAAFLSMLRDVDLLDEHSDSVVE